MRAVTVVLLAGIALTGCPNSNDVDGDGIDAPLDCDDNNPDVFPGNVEACDGIDNNCDTVHGREHRGRRGHLVPGQRR